MEGSYVHEKSLEMKATVASYRVYRCFYVFMITKRAVWLYADLAGSSPHVIVKVHDAWFAHRFCTGCIKNVHSYRVERAFIATTTFSANQTVSVA